ncbi:GNAT family N-acetyltransferase [Paenibacillus sp. CMAA1739]|nr:GNAT family N-acetyltransferase [Paenibacillus sp. CMAA1739]MEC4569395.1 GNAT family N-acetyltransferase [Paenibacillus sp. CMAA1739]
MMWFVVDPAAQGQRYGRKLLNWVEHTIIRDQLGAPAVIVRQRRSTPISIYVRAVRI